MSTLTEGRIYVGTYAKYNNGSIGGQWLDLSDYDNQQDFYTACAELHSDESDPEFMFQDWENIPSQYIGESHIYPEYWDFLEAVNASYLDADAFAAGIELDIPMESIEEAYQGQYDSDTDFAYQLADDIGAIDHKATWPNSYIDWEAAARDLMFDYAEQDGYYFSSNY